jgi:hypothetical protein
MPRSYIGNQGVTVMEGEGELTRGLLASFRLILSADVGVKEIEPLLNNMEIDKAILADESKECGHQ